MLYIRFVSMTETPTTQCPKCGKGLVNIGSRLERIHPIPVFIRKYSDRILAGWIITTLPILWTVAEIIEGPDLRFIMNFWMGMIACVGLILFLVPKFFDVYRITNCPYCGYKSKMNIGSGLGV